MTRYARFRTPDCSPRWARVRDDARLAVLHDAPWRDARETGELLARESVRLLAPAEPTKILALAYNYRDLFADPAAKASAREPHFTDPGFEPLVFLKGPNCVTDPEAELRVPGDADEVWVEVEITAIIARRVRRLAGRDEARAAIAGLTIGNDVTALNILGRDWHLARSKSLDGFCPLGPELVTDFDDTNVELATSINGRCTQRASTANRVLDTLDAVILASRIMTLEPGDAILTGTPAGARQSLVKPGDRVEMTVAGLGTLVNTVELDAA